MPPHLICFLFWIEWELLVTESCLAFLGLAYHSCLVEVHQLKHSSPIRCTCVLCVTMLSAKLKHDDQTSKLLRYGEVHGLHDGRNKLVKDKDEQNATALRSFQGKLLSLQTSSAKTPHHPYINNHLDIYFFEFILHSEISKYT